VRGHTSFPVFFYFFLLLPPNHTIIVIVLQCLLFSPKKHLIHIFNSMYYLKSNIANNYWYFKLETSTMNINILYSQTCIKRSPLTKWPYKTGDLLKEVQLTWNVLGQDKKRLPLNTCDCLIEVTAWAGLT
jgi:hypothetical protein